MSEAPPRATEAANLDADVEHDAAKIEWASDDAAGLSWIDPWLELKTVWQPVGL